MVKWTRITRDTLPPKQRRPILVVKQTSSGQTIDVEYAHIVRDDCYGTLFEFGGHLWFTHWAELPKLPRRVKLDVPKPRKVSSAVTSEPKA